MRKLFVLEKKRIKENKIVAFKNNNNLSGRSEILIAFSNSKDRASIEVPENSAIDFWQIDFWRLMAYTFTDTKFGKWSHRSQPVRLTQ